MQVPCRRRKMKYFPIILFSLFVVFIDWVAISSRLDNKKIKKMCTIQVKALCSKIRYTTTIKHNVEWIIYCTYEYGNRIVKNATPRIQFPHKPKEFTEGDEVDILVNPDNPYQYIFAHPEFDFGVLFADILLSFMALFFTSLLVLGAIARILGD